MAHRTAGAGASASAPTGDCCCGARCPSHAPQWLQVSYRGHGEREREREDNEEEEIAAAVAVAVARGREEAA